MQITFRRAPPNVYWLTLKIRTVHKLIHTLLCMNVHVHTYAEGEGEGREIEREKEKDTPKILYQGAISHIVSFSRNDSLYFYCCCYPNVWLEVASKIHTNEKKIPAGSASWKAEMNIINAYFIYVCVCVQMVCDTRAHKWRKKELSY